MKEILFVTSYSSLRIRVRVRVRIRIRDIIGHKSHARAFFSVTLGCKYYLLDPPAYIVLHMNSMSYRVKNDTFAAGVVQFIASIT